MHPVTTAPSTAPLSPRIKWSRISKEKEVVLLVATEGQVRVNSAYQDKVSLPNYPAIPSDATLEIQNLRSNDSGMYRCEVMHGIEDSEATLEVVVKGEDLPRGCCFAWGKSQNGILTAVDPDRPVFRSQLPPTPSLHLPRSSQLASAAAPVTRSWSCHSLWTWRELNTS